MVRTLVFILLFFPSICFSQIKYSLDYTKIVDFNGSTRTEHNQKGTWYFTEDSLLVQKYESDSDSLTYNVVEFKNRRIFYRNDFDEIIEVVFMNDMVTVKSNLRPNQYIIFRKK